MEIHEFCKQQPCSAIITSFLLYPFSNVRRFQTLGEYRVIQIVKLNEIINPYPRSFDFKTLNENQSNLKIRMFLFHPRKSLQQTLFLFYFSLS